MPINLYDKPAEYVPINTYVPFEPVAELLYKQGLAKQAKADENKKAADEAAKKDPVLAWYDVYANENNIKNKISERISEINRTIDPSSSEYMMAINEILNDKEINTFYSGSKANKEIADKYREAPQTSAYKEGTRWERIKTDAMLNNLNVASSKEEQGGSQYIWSYHGDTGLISPSFTKAVDPAQIFIENANKLNPAGYSVVNGGLYFKTESGLEEVTEERIAQINGLIRNPNTGEYNWDASIYNTEWGKTASDNAKAAAFGESYIITGDPNFDQKIEYAINAPDSELDKEITFKDYESGDPLTVSVGDIKGAYNKAMQVELDGALERAYAEAWKKTKSGSVMTSYAFDEQRKKDEMAGLPDIPKRVPSVPTDGKEFINNAYDIGAKRLTAINTTITAARDLVEQAGYSIEGQSNNWIFTMAQNIQKSLSATGGSTYENPVTKKSYNISGPSASYNTAINQQKSIDKEFNNVKEVINDGYIEYSQTQNALDVRGELKSTNFLLAYIKQAGFDVENSTTKEPVTSKNIDKFILAIQYPDVYGDLIFKNGVGLNEDERIKYKTFLKMRGAEAGFAPENIKEDADNLRNNFEEHARNQENFTFARGGDSYVLVPSSDKSMEALFNQKVSETLSNDPQLFADMKLADGTSVLDKLIEKKYIDITHSVLWTTTGTLDEEEMNAQWDNFFKNNKITILREHDAEKSDKLVRISIEPKTKEGIKTIIDAVKLSPEFSEVIEYSDRQSLYKNKLIDKRENQGNMSEATREAYRVIGANNMDVEPSNVSKYGSTTWAINKTPIDVIATVEKQGGTSKYVIRTKNRYTGEISAPIPEGELQGMIGEIPSDIKDLQVLSGVLYEEYNLKQTQGYGQVNIAPQQTTRTYNYSGEEEGGVDYNIFESE